MECIWLPAMPVMTGLACALSQSSLSGKQTDAVLRLLFLLPIASSSYSSSSSSVSNNIYLTRPAAKADWLWKEGFLCGGGGLGSSTLELGASMAVVTAVRLLRYLG